MQRRSTHPADDVAAPLVEDRREVKPAFGRLQLRDIGQPALVGSGRRRTRGDEVGGDWLGVPTVLFASPWSAERVVR